MKFDYIIQNPPYAGSLHLDIFDKTLDLLSEKGRMTIIEPATWLINVRRNGKAKKYDAIKERLKGHVYKVVIENFDSDFFVNLYVPCSITYIDMDNVYDKIEFVCCGETKQVKSLYDCNLIGSYDMIWSILNKINTEKVEKHTYRPGKSEKIEGNWYCRFADIISGAGSQLCAIFDTARNPRKLSQNDFNKFFEDKTQIVFIKHNFGDFLQNYSTILYHRYKNDICNSPLHTYDKAKRLSNKEAPCITGTKEELENWKHFVFNNKLPLFINIVMTIDQNNNSLPYVPWLVDKQYTDDEINKLFGFTDEEIKLINNTVAKYEWHSPFYKRRMCGPTSVSDEEVQRFCDELNKNK